MKSESDLGPLEVLCDAPPYSIIQACRRVGVQDPEDVRWLRVSHLEQQDGDPQRETLNPLAWKSLLGMSKWMKLNCTCGQRLPTLEKCTFTFITGKELSYHIGQCRRCRTVYWEEA